MSTGSRIGKTYPTNDFIKSIPDSQLLVEAAIRRGQNLTHLIEPISPNLQKTDLYKWKNALMTAQNVDYPNRIPMYEIYDNIRIDNTLTSIIDTRILKAKQAKFKLVDKDGKPDVEAKKLFEKEWFQNFIEYSLMAKFQGFNLIETFDFDPITGELLKATEVNKYHVKPEKGIVTKFQFDTEGLSYLDNPFYIPVGNTKDLGLLYKAAIHVMAKKFALGAWAEFNEKVGIPFRTVHTNTTDKTRQQQLATIMDKMGSAGWAVLTEGEKVELMGMAGNDPTGCFEKLIAKLDSEIAMLFNGQSSTSNSQNNKGTYGSMQILQDISDDRHESDLVSTKYLINGVLIPNLMILSPAYSKLKDRYFEWDKSEDLTVAETVDYVVALSAVYEIDPEFVTQKTGIPILGMKQIIPPNIPPAKPTAIKKKSLTANIEAFYSDKCCTHSSSPSAVSPNGYEADVLRVAKLLFDGKQKGVVDYGLLKKTASELKDALLTGYTTSTDNKNVEMLKALEQNIFVFSGFKTYQQLKDIGSKLKDENGNIRSFNDFKTEVLKVNQSYNVRYLATEYDNTMVSAQMASQWLDIQANKHILPFLKFDATLDNRTTNTCRSLDGTTLPVDHPFWDTYYLPLHWHERSIIQQVANGSTTDLSTIVTPDLQPMFQGNVGKQGVIFPKSHPYYETSVSASKQIMDAVNKLYPDPTDYKSIYKSKSGGEVLVHSIHNEKELKSNTTVAKIIADNNYTVKLLDYIEGRKNPDASINDILSDFKNIETPTRNAVQGCIKSAAHQKVAIAIISIPKILTNESIVHALYAALYDETRNKSITDVWFITTKKKLIKIKRIDIVNGLVKNVL
jgi:hypothetical protein